MGRRLCSKRATVISFIKVKYPQRTLQENKRVKKNGEGSHRTEGRNAREGACILEVAALEKKARRQRPAGAITSSRWDKLSEQRKADNSCLGLAQRREEGER